MSGTTNRPVLVATASTLCASWPRLQARMLRHYDELEFDQGFWRSICASDLTKSL